MSTSITDTTDSRIERARERLSAVLLTSGEWAHYDDGMRRWYVVDEDELASLVDYLDHADPDVRGDAYSHWCASTCTREATVREVCEAAAAR